MYFFFGIYTSCHHFLFHYQLNIALYFILRIRKKYVRNMRICKTGKKIKIYRIRYEQKGTMIGLWYIDVMLLLLLLLSFTSSFSSLPTCASRVISVYVVFNAYTRKPTTTNPVDDRERKSEWESHTWRPFISTASFTAYRDSYWVNAVHCQTRQRPNTKFPRDASQDYYIFKIFNIPV